jgi:effector-binding domain-containing protein
MALAAGAVLFVSSILCATGRAQEPVDAAAVKDLLARIDAARGATANSLLIDGTYEVTFEGVDTPVAKGAFRERFAGSGLARHTTEMGPHGKMEKGVFKDLVWELDPSMGARVHRGQNAAASRRYLDIVRGASPRDLYTGFEAEGTRQIDGRELTVLRMTPEIGKPDLWYVAADGTVVRIDTHLPAPESAGASFGMDDMMETQITFADWKQAGDARYPHKRTLRMGPAVVTSICSKVQANTEIDTASFEPPKAVREAKVEDAEPAFRADGSPNFQIVDRQPQAVASIRVKCKPSEISATLAVLLPEVMAHVNSVGGRLAGPPFSRYHAFSESEIDIEAGIPVQARIEAGGRVANSELPGGRVVTAWHVGPYDGLSAAHEAMGAYIESKKLKITGGCWETYWTDPGMVPDPSKWRTQLFSPIE